MALTRYDVTDRQPSYVVADLYNFAGVLMATDHGDFNGLLCPIVPVVNVNIGATDRRLMNLDEDFVSRNLGNGHVLKP